MHNNYYLFTMHITSLVVLLEYAEHMSLSYLAVCIRYESNMYVCTMHNMHTCHILSDASRSILFYVSNGIFYKLLVERSIVIQ